MGEAKRRNRAAGPVVYHHTSVLRTNQLWMSGEIKVEGRMMPVLHPHLGELQTDARFRRPMKDFAPVAWFTKQIAVPHCLQVHELAFIQESGERHTMEIGHQISNAIAMQRFALGFKAANLELTWWPDHPGYGTAEGQHLNETARDVGDNPRDWYVSEKPVDLMWMSEVWFCREPGSVKLKREDWYLADIKRMVMMCRETPGVFIPPSWLSQEQAREVGRRLGLTPALLR